MTRHHRHKVRQKPADQKTRQQRFADKATMVVAVVEPAITIPQAWQIFRDHTAAGVSLSTWVGYEVLTVVWLWYGIVHKEKMILLYQGLYAIVQTAVLIGAIKYGAKW